MALADSSLTLQIDYNPGPPPKPTLRNIDSSTVMRIVPTGTPRVAAKVDVNFVFQLTPNGVVTQIPVTDVAKDDGTGGYRLSSNQVNVLAKALYAQLQAATVPVNPDTKVVTKRIEVQLPPDPTTIPPNVPASIPTTNQLTVSFEFILSTAALSSYGGAGSLAARQSGYGASQATATVSRDPMMRRTSTGVAAQIDGFDPPPLPAKGQTDLDVVLTQEPPPLPASIVNAAQTDINKLLAKAAAANVPPGILNMGGTFQLPGSVKIQIPGTNQTIDLPGTVALSLPNPTPAAAPPRTPIIVPQAHSINVSVPVTNIARQPKQGGLFHRDKAPISPQNPTKPPLVERLLNRP
jgi:hypothetical protein